MEELNDALDDLDDLNQIKISVLTQEICKLDLAKSTIVTVFENRIRKCSQKDLLPIMCLIDSIVKYSGELANLFSKNIADTYIYCYEKMVTQEEREKMIKILNTWSNGVPFPPASVSKLFDKYINKRKYTETEEKTTNKRLSKNNVNNTTNNTNNTNEVVPTPTVIAPQIPIQPNPLMQPNPLATNPLTALNYGVQDSYTTMAFHLLGQLKQGFVNLQNLNALINLIPYVSNEVLQNILRVEAQLILTNLQQSIPQQPTPQTTPVTSETTINPDFDSSKNESPPKNDINPQKKKKPKFKSSFKPEGLSFKYIDLKKRNNDAINSLYDPNINRCDCGIRFQDSEKYKDHLNWHFKSRKNKKTNKTIYRSFYLVGDDWAIGSSNVESDKTDTKSNKEVIEEVQEDIFLATDDAGSLERKCSICTDKFVEKWKPNKESWILVDCVKIDNKLFHNTCYKEYLSDTKAVNPESVNVSIF